jgi:hypothetical protein
LSYSHSQVGIMRPRWYRDELNGLAMERLLFTSHESKLMKDKLYSSTKSEPSSPGLSLNRVPRKNHHRENALVDSGKM